MVAQIRLLLCLVLLAVVPASCQPLTGALYGVTASKPDPIAELASSLAPVLKSLAPVLESLAPALQKLGPILDQLLGSLVTPFNVTAANPPDTPLELLIQGLLGPNGLLTGLLKGAGAPGGLANTLKSTLGSVTSAVGSLPTGNIVGSLGSTLGSLGSKGKPNSGGLLSGLVKTVDKATGQRGLPTGGIVGSLGSTLGSLGSKGKPNSGGLLSGLVKTVDKATGQRGLPTGGIVGSLGSTLGSLGGKGKPNSGGLLSGLVKTVDKAAGQLIGGGGQRPVLDTVGSVVKPFKTELPSKGGLDLGYSPFGPADIPFVQRSAGGLTGSRARLPPTESCESHCPPVYRPVCSNKGSTYSNPCMLGCSGEKMQCPGDCPCQPGW